MPKSKPQIVICTYRVRRGKEVKFRGLLRKHWPVLNRSGLVATEPHIVLRGLGDSCRGDFIEVFAWKSRGLEGARNSPAVLAIWEAMEQLCEPRDGRPATEFPHYEMVR